MQNLRDLQDQKKNVSKPEKQTYKQLEEAV